MVHSMVKRRQMDPDGKRASIMACGEKLFAAGGYTNTSMADIAGAAGVAVGTLYRLFPDKPSLLGALHARMEDRFIAAMHFGWNQEQSLENRFAPMVEALFVEAQKVKDIFPLYSMTRDAIGVTDYVPGHSMINAIEIQYREGVEAGVFRDIPAGILGPMAHALVEGAFRAWMLEPNEIRMDLIKAELIALFRLGFLVEKQTGDIGSMGN